MPRILSPEEYAERYEGFRVDVAPRGAIAAGLSSGIDQVQGLGYGLLGAGLDAVGLDKAAQWTQDRRKLNEAEGYYAGRPDLDQIENISLGNAGDMLAYQLAKQGPTIAALVGANYIPGVGQVANRLGLSALGARVPTALGGGGLRAGADLAARQAAARAGQEFGSSAVLGGAIGAGSLYNQSVDAGDPSPFSAFAAAPVYGALEAAVPSAVRGALRAPANLPGGLVRRMGAAGALGALGEAGTELAQNEMEMAFGPALTDEEAYSQRLNAAALGAMVGGPLGSLGGIRRPQTNTPRTVDQGQFDLTQQQNPAAAPAPQYNLTTQMDPLQGRIDRAFGLQRTARKDYEKQFLEAFNAPSGFRVADPATGLERELSVGEYQQMQLGDLRAPSEQGVANTQQLGNTPTSAASAPAPAPAPAAPSILTESDQFYANTVQMPLPQGKARRAVLEQLYNDAVASGVPVDAPALEPYWNQIGTGNYYGKNQQDRLRVLLQNAIVEYRKGSANVSQPSAPAGQPVGSGDGRSAAPVGGMGNPGSVPDVRVGAGGNAGDTQPAGGQAAPVADAGVQRPAAVGENTSILGGTNPAPTPNQESMARVRTMPGFSGDDPNAAFVSGMRAASPQPTEAPTPADPFQVSGEPIVQRKRRKVTVQPGAQPTAYVTPEAPDPKANAPVAEDGYVDDEDAWEDFRPDVSPSFGDLSPGLQRSWADLRRMGKLSRETAEQITAEHEADDSNETGEIIRDVINQIFDKRDADIIHDVFVGKMTAAQVAEKYGLDSSRVRQIAGTGKEGQSFRNKKIKAAQDKYGWTDEYVRSLMGDIGGADSNVELDTDMTDGRSAPGIEDDNSQQRDIAAFGATGDLTLGDVGMSTISSEGGSTGYKDTIGNRTKALTKEEIDKLNTMRDGRAALERELAEAERNGDEERAEKIQGDIAEIDAKIERLESGKATPQDMAASMSQEWYDLTAKADELESRVRAAIDAGLDTLTDTKKGKRALAEAQQEIEAIRAKAANTLEKAKKLLEGLRETAPAAGKKANAPKKEAKPKVEKKATTAIATKPKQDSGQTLWESLRAQSPDLVAYDELTANERGYLTELADRTNGKPKLKDELGLQELMKRQAPAQIADDNVIDVEARVVEETVGAQVALLPAPRVQRLENHYGVKSGTKEFLERVKEDVVTFATKGAEAVSAAIRDIIKAIHAGVLSVAMVFNPTGVSSPEAFAIIPPVETVTVTREVRAELPAEVRGMSEAGKQAYGTLVPALKGKNGDKLLVMADKPSGRIFVFDADGKLIVQQKALFGLAKGDFYKGNNDLPQNRITPAGLFGLELVDAAKGGSAKVTAGDYDFGKVFAFKDPDAVVTIMHSVWLKEKDAGKRAAALKNDNPADSRYSFGCINVDKATYKFLLDNYEAQMDGSKLFVVPDNQEAVKDFIAGTVPSDRLVREGVQPVTETVTTRTTVPDASKQAQRGQVGREEKYLFGKTADNVKPVKAENPYTAKELLAELKDFIRADIPGRKLFVVDTIADLLRHPDKTVRVVGASIALEGAYGVASNGRAYLVADRIQKGSGRAKFMHEVGAHLGLEKLLPKAVYDKLTKQITEWAKKDDGSVESELALNAVERVQNAGTKQEHRRAELLAYFIEEAMEAGIDPTAEVKNSGPLRDWFRTLWAAFKIAVRKLGFKPESLNAQDVVNLAFGAARLEIAGTWHGTAASFRNFRNKYIGTGEGATAFGWGTYLAQRAGIAKGYWSADVERKSSLEFDGVPIMQAYRAAKAAQSAGEGDPAQITAKYDALRQVVKALQDRSIKKDHIYFAHLELERLADGANPDDYNAQALKWFEENIGLFKERKPEGSLMRVDVAVDDDKLLDYDKPVIKQPNFVANKLMELLDPVADDVVDMTNKDVEELTGTDLIGSGERDLGLLSRLIMDDAVSLEPGQDKQFDEAVRQGKFHEAASHFLRALGIQGIKFYDAKSRGTATQVIIYDGRSYNRDDLRDQVRKYRDTNPDKAMQFSVLENVLRDGFAYTKDYLEERIAEHEQAFFKMEKYSAAQRGVEFDKDKALAQAKADVARLPEGKKLAWLNANEKNISVAELPKTRNLVIFDDRDIFRVGAESAADRQRMKFGRDPRFEGLPDALDPAIDEKDSKGTWGSQSKLDRALRLMDRADKAKDPAVADNLRAQAEKLMSEAAAGMAKGDKRMKFGKNSSVPAAVKPQVDIVTKTLRTGAGAALNKIVFSEDLFKRASDLGLTAAMDMDRIYRERAALTGNIEREVTRIENLFNRIPKAFQGTGPRSANQFLYDSTREAKWGFKPKWRTGSSANVKVDPAMEQRFNALPKEAKAWIEAVFQHGDKMLALKKKTLIESTNSEYDALIADAKARGETNKATRLENDKAASLRQFQRLFAATEFNPYAPMRRFGDFVVVAKSKEYLAAQTAAERTKLEKDPDHYHVSFAESRASALELERQLKEQGHFDSVTTKAKEDARKDMYGGLMDAFNKLRQNIDSELGNATEPKEIAALRAARETVVELYLQSLAENSARKSEMRRRGVAGEIDMLRSFSTQGRADAHFLASAKYNPQTSQAVVKMRQQVNEGANTLEKSDAFKEILARHTQSMRYEEGGWFDVANNAARVTSLWLLTTNPMYYLQNLTQPFVLSLPFMTGKHDWSAAAGQLLRSYFQLGDLLKSAKIGEGFDFTKVSKDKGEQDMILKLVDRGRIDIGMDTELGQVRLEGDNAAGRAATRADQFLRSLSQKVEAINRVSTALTAYRLEIKAGKTPAQALEYADQVIAQTHGDYSRINAPRAFNTPAGKVALQFRKFQLIQLTLLSKLVYNSFKGGTAAERAAARKMLTFTLGHTGVLAGVVGLPGFAAASFVIGKLVDAFGDDDEPYNFENELRKLLGDGDLARVIMRGAPNLAGADLSGKLGMGNALSILPYTDFDASREGFNAIATGLTLGATGGLGARVFQALGDIKDGDYYRGLMGLSPALLSQGIRAYVEADRGETNRRGDVLVSAEEISNWESFAKVIGWPTSAVSERRFDRQVAYDNKEAFESKAAKIKNEYTRAVRSNDADGRRQAIEKWQRLQNSRREAGFKPQPLSTLMKAPQEQAKRERNTAGGVQFNRQNRQFVMEQTQ